MHPTSSPPKSARLLAIESTNGWTHGSGGHTCRGNTQHSCQQEVLRALFASQVHGGASPMGKRLSPEVGSNRWSGQKTDRTKYNGVFERRAMTRIGGRCNPLPPKTPPKFCTILVSMHPFHYTWIEEGCLPSRHSTPQYLGAREYRGAQLVPSSSEVGGESPTWVESNSTEAVDEADGLTGCAAISLTVGGSRAAMGARLAVLEASS